MAIRPEKGNHQYKVLVMALFCLLMGSGIQRASGQRGEPLIQERFVRAVERGDTNEVRTLLQQGADPNLRMDYAIQPLMWANVPHQLLGEEQSTPSSAPTVLIAAVQSNRLAIVQLLLERGADMGLKDEYKDTALFCAMANNTNECVKVLLAHGASVRSRTTGGLTPLFCAALMDVPQAAECIPLLLKHGAKIDERAGGGVTPLMFAVALPWMNDSSSRLRLLIAQGANVNARDKKGVSALLFASTVGDVEAVQTLLQMSAKLNAQDASGKTALMYAVAAAHEAKKPRHGCLDLPRRPLSSFLATIQLLLDKGMNTKLKDKTGKTALQIAEELQDEEVLALLRKTPTKDQKAP